MEKEYRTKGKEVERVKGMELKRVMVMEKVVQTVDPGGTPSEEGKKEDLRAEMKTTQQVSGKPTWHLCNLYAQIILPQQTK